MNHTQIYQGLINLDKSNNVEQKIQEERDKENNLLFWKTWRELPAGQVFIKTLAEIREAKIRSAYLIASSSVSATSLNTIRVIDEILEKTLIDGTFNP